MMRGFKRPNKRQLILFGASLALLLIGAYVWASVTYWNGFESNLMTQQQELKSLQQAAVTGNSTDERLKAIRVLDDRLATRGTLCQTSAVFGWQAAIVPVLREGLTECRDVVKKLERVAGPLSALRDYLDVGVQLQAIIKKLAPEGALTEKNWSEQGLEKAKTVQKEISAITATDRDAAALKRQSAEAANNLVGAWEALNKANQAKDKTGFLSSAASVLKAYADFASIADASDEMIKKKASALLSAADSL